MRAVAIIVVLLAPAATPADDGPFDAPGHPVTSDAATASAAVSPAPPPLSIRAYRTVSSFQGPRCPHRPTCSAYAAEAMHRHGAVLGALIGVSRLLRGDRSSALRPLDRAPDGALLDPLEAATFFLPGDRP